MPFHRTTPLIMLALFAACSSKKIEEVKRLNAFEFPFDSLVKPRVFVYEQIPAGEPLKIRQTKVTEGGVDYMCMESFVGNQLNERSRYKVFPTSALIAENVFFYRDPASGKAVQDVCEVLKFTNINDGSPFRGVYYELTTIDPSNIKGRISSRETFLRNDKMWLGDSVVDVLVFDHEIVTTTWHRYMPFAKKSNKYTGELYLARGIGIVKMTRRSDKEFIDWRLRSIETD